VLLTRLDLFIKRRRVRKLPLARAAGYSRQHLLRMRLGQQEPSRRFVLDMTQALSAATGEAIKPGQLFERADQLLLTNEKRLRSVHAQDLRLVDHLVANAADADAAASVEAAGIASETAVRHLYYAGQKRIDKQPREAAVIFYAAALMATRLPAGTPAELKASLQAASLKGRANALRHLGKFDDALADLRVASRLFVAARYCTSEAGQVEYSRGGIYFTMERWAEAINAAMAARQHFLAANDMRRVAHADILIAVSHFEQGNTALALEIWLQVERLLTALNDRDNLARVWHNLAVLEISRRDADKARSYLDRAAETFRQLGNAVELARTEWSRATYIATFDSPAQAIPALRRVRRAFAELGDQTNVACVGLQLVELRSATAPHADAALARDASSVADDLIRLGLSVSAANALDQLRRIAVARNRRAIIEEVRAALRDHDISCHPAWTEADEAENDPDPVNDA
jgi:tetratricopeptide (TPR) repeat protein